MKEFQNMMSAMIDDKTNDEFVNVTKSGIELKAFAKFVINRKEELLNETRLYTHIRHSGSASIP
jgi:hypothetical protein